MIEGVVEQVCIENIDELDVRRGWWLYISFLQVRSLGVLMKYLEKKRVGFELEESGVRVPILAIRRFSL